jgi:hypothetical protein
MWIALFTFAVVAFVGLSAAALLVGAEPASRGES